MEDAGLIGYQLPQDLVALRDQVRRIIQDLVIPAESHVDPTPPKFSRTITGRLQEEPRPQVCWCMGSPQQYGRGGLGMFDMCVLQEQMCQHRMGLYNPGAGVFGRTPSAVILSGNRKAN
jgi:acyl-CoA dehydrogenase